MASSDQIEQELLKRALENEDRIPRSLATAGDLFLVSTGVGSWVVKTISQVAAFLNQLLVPYNGASADVNLGTYEIAAGTAAIGDGTNQCVIEADGTIRLDGDATGYVDIFFPHGLPKTTGVGNPALATYLGNLRGYEYAVNDAHDLDPQEYYHQCPTGGDILWHIHWISRTNVAADRTVKFELERSVAASNGVETLISPNATVEVTIPANTVANTHYLTNIVTDTVANIGPGWILSARIKRIASSGTEPATNPIVKALHGHVKIDTPAGSRTVSSK